MLVIYLLTYNFQNDRCYFEMLLFTNIIIIMFVVLSAIMCFSNGRWPPPPGEAEGVSLLEVSGEIFSFSSSVYEENKIHLSYYKFSSTFFPHISFFSSKQRKLFSLNFFPLPTKIQIPNTPLMFCEKKKSTDYIFLQFSFFFYLFSLFLCPTNRLFLKTLHPV